MKLQRIIINNLAVFRGRRKFDFDNNIVTIYGNNFSGKTTLSQAIYFAICGKGLTTGLKPKELITSNKTSATVEIVYSISDQIYRTFRSSRGDVQHEILQNQLWQLIEDEDVKLPGLNPQQWQIGCFLKEEELGEFVTKTPSNRRDLLNQLLGVGQLMRAQDSFIKVRRLTKRKEKTLLSQQSSLRLDETEDCSVDLEEYQKKLTLFEGKLISPEDAEGRQLLREEWEQQKDTIQKQIKTNTEKYQSLLTGFNSVVELRDILQETVNRTSERDRYLQELESFREKRIELSEKFKQIDEMLTIFKDLHGQKICPTCQQTISEEHTSNLKEKYKKTYDDLKVQLESAGDDEGNARETIDLLERLVRREVDLRKRLEQLGDLDKKLAENQLQLESVESKIVSVSDITDIEKDHIQLKREIDQTRIRVRDLEKKHALHQENRRKIDELHQKASTSTLHRFLSEWSADAVVLTLESIIGSSLKRVENNVISCLEEFNLFEGDDIKIDLEKSKLMPGIGNRNFKTLSGSEKTILYLGMKLALSRLMPGANFFVFDNPTLHLDEQRRKLMKDYLFSLIPEKQIILLTSDRAFADLITKGKRIDL